MKSLKGKLLCVALVLSSTACTTGAETFDVVLFVDKTTASRGNPAPPR